MSAVRSSVRCARVCDIASRKKKPQSGVIDISASLIFKEGKKAAALAGQSVVKERETATFVLYVAVNMSHKFGLSVSCS